MRRSWWPGASRSTGCHSAWPATARGDWWTTPTTCWPSTRPPRPTGSSRPSWSSRPDDLVHRRSAARGPDQGYPAVTFPDVEIVTDSAPLGPPAGGSAVTIGAYDGVHLGHRALLAELRTRAEERGLATVVVTFDRHPAAVVRPESAPLLLCDLDQKLELLASAGVDRTVVIRFDAERANETAEEFVSRELVDGLEARLVVVGEDFHFGHGRKGNVALLTEMGSVAGFAVDGVTLSSEAGAGSDAPAVSSTRVRSLVTN